MNEAVFFSRGQSTWHSQYRAQWHAQHDRAIRGSASRCTHTWTVTINATSLQELTLLPAANEIDGSEWQRRWDEDANKERWREPGWGGAPVIQSSWGVRNGIVQEAPFPGDSQVIDERLAREQAQTNAAFNRIPIMGSQGRPVYLFGGLCHNWERQPSARNKRENSGRDQ